MRQAITAVLGRYDDDKLAFLNRALGELCEAARVVIAVMGAGQTRDGGTRTRARAGEGASVRPSKSRGRTPRVGP